MNDPLLPPVLYPRFVYKPVQIIQSIPPNPSVEFLTDLVSNYFFFGYDDNEILTPVMEYLMTKTPPNVIEAIVYNLGFNQLNATIDVFYDLLWYINVVSFNNNNNMEIRSYVSSLDAAQLLIVINETLFQSGSLETYRENTNRAALIFTLISGVSLPYIEKSFLRSKDVTRYPPASVWYITTQMYYFDDKSLGDNPGPYEYLLSQSDSKEENIAVAVNENTVIAIMNHMNIIAPSDQVFNRTPENLIKFTINELKTYRTIFSRSRDFVGQVLDLRTIIENEDIAEAEELLAFYTIGELINKYEPSKNSWTNREELIDIIIDDSQEPELWSKRNKFCNNDNTQNEIDLEAHGNINKNNPEDPTYSYGVQGNYSCYQSGELEGSWMNYENEGFQFRVPDWDDQNPDSIKNFPVASIRRLRRIADQDQRSEAVTNLINKIDIGLLEVSQQSQAIITLKQNYEQLSEDDKSSVNLYLAWIFQLGMTARYWKGLGNEWPLLWVERIPDDNNLRDEYVHLQFMLKDILIRQSSQEARRFVGSLYFINKDLTTDLYSVSDNRVDELLNNIRTANFCLAHASDILLKTSEYTIELLKDTNLDGLNHFLAENLPALLRIEFNGDLSIASMSVEDARERMTQLIDQNVLPPRFDPDQLQETRHFDPQHGMVF